jgi:polysaccharide export outer membrane protein
MRLLSLLVLSVLVFGSCVTNKKFQLMQKNDVNKRNMPSDSVFRKYSTKAFDYKIQTNDIISIRFESLTSKEYDFFAPQTNVVPGVGFVGGSLLAGDLVDENGEVPFPVVGKIKVAGMTIFEIQDYLQGIANKYLESPIVKVRLLNFRVTFLGEFNREGVVVLNNNRVSMLEAIGLSGGLTDLADKTSIKLIRQKGEKAEVIYLNLLDENFISSPYYFVNQNDVIVAPPLSQRIYQKYLGQNINLLVAALSLLLIAVTLTRQ